MTERVPDVRERIVRAAADLLARGGRDAVSTRAVSAAAGVQAPAIYRQFGDMRELLRAAAREIFTRYVRQKSAREPSADPVEDLRRGWDEHVAFGLANPAAYMLLYGSSSDVDERMLRDGLAVLQALVERVAKAGRLGVTVGHAVQLIHAGGRGATLSLITAPPKERDLRLSEAMREAVLAAILVPGRATKRAAKTAQVVAHAVALKAGLSETGDVLSEGERLLLGEWLDRLAAARD